MRGPFPEVTLFLCSLLFPACRAPVGWSSDEALAAESVEVQMDRDGRLVEVEYHLAPDRVPANVREAMDALHPGGRATAAEKEYVGSTLYWEVTKEIEGREVEALFLPDGTLHSEEVEVAAAGVPSAVQDAVRARLAGEVTKWEEIRDGERRLVEYHAKVTVADARYKLMVSAEGAVRAVVREVPAEIEVPLR